MIYYFSELLNDKITNSLFTEEEIKLFLLEFTMNLNIEPFLNDIIFVNKGNNLATYDLEDKNLAINLQKIINTAKFYYKGDDFELNLFTNILILFTLIHEITHIHQNSRANNKDSITKIINQEFVLFNIISQKEYDKYWALFTSEREANTNAYEYILYYLKYITPNKDMYKYFFNDLVKALTHGYKIHKKEIIAPMQIIHKRFAKNGTIKISLEDIYDSLKYGAPLTKEKYQSYISDKEKIITRRIASL